MNPTTPPLVKNAGDEDQVKDAARKEKSARERELNDMRAVLGTPAGRRVIWRYMFQCGAFQDGFDESTNYAFFRKGQRNVALMMLSDINDAAPEAYLLMLKEAKGAN